VAVTKAIVQIVNEGGTPYVSLSQVSVLLEGNLRTFPVSRRDELSLEGHTLQFFFNSSKVLVDGRRRRLEAPTIKNSDGFWVPVRFFSTPEFFHLAKVKLDWPPAETESPMPKAESGKPNAAVSSPLSAPRLHVIRRIVIDPGHGGKDPGTVGAKGTEEKAINLMMAQELADVLREKDDYEVLLTRMDDSFIPLEQRAQLANKYKADLFISLHCNASLSSRMKGFEVYFLSEKASDPHADAVAQLENASLTLEGKSARAPRRLAAVLRSLVKNANINEASALGSIVDRHVGARLSQPHLGVKEAAFYVLRGAEMPAILIETAFLSNPKEEHLLRDPSFRHELIQGIEAGITEFDQRKTKEREREHG
jgi:N-acetylmuramoyl-L-alanine amidase